MPSVHVFGWKTLKKLYPLCTYYITALCVCVLIFKNIDEVIATITAATIKNKDRKKDFYDAGLPSPPPDPIIARWATWLRAA